jgi:hypothetical protein
MSFWYRSQSPKRSIQLSVGWSRLGMPKPWPPAVNGCDERRAVGGGVIEGGLGGYIATRGEAHDANLGGIEAPLSGVLEGLGAGVRSGVPRAELSKALNLRPDQRITLAQTVGYIKK